jgi:DNA polymerase III subunit delta
MKIPPARIEGFVAKPDPVARAILVYGPDAGLVRERADRLTRSVVPDLADPFRIAELSAPLLRDDPARLGDEAAQVAMIGGRRVVRVREATDGIAAPLAAFLDTSVGDALIVVEAGDLAARAKLRALFETADNAAAIPCYADNEEAVAAVVREMLRAAGLAAAPDALDYLTSHLGGDRLLTRREIEKLILYMGSPATGAQVRLEDVEACIGDSAAHSIDDAVLATADGDGRTAEHALERAFAEGESAVGILRAAQRYFQRLHFAAGQVEAGAAPDRVVESLKPRLFWKIKPRFIAQLRYWSPARLGQALDRLTAAEIACKSTGLPDQAIAVRCFLELAGAAGRQKRRG